jgi:hypothetical protein
MWIPTPVQERLPMFWLLLGLLFIAAGIFLGFDYSATFIYLAIGTICIFWSFCLVALRPRKPNYARVGGSSEADHRPRYDDDLQEQSAPQLSIPQPIIEPMVDVSDLPEHAPEHTAELSKEDS